MDRSSLLVIPGGQQSLSMSTSDLPSASSSLADKLTGAMPRSGSGGNLLRNPGSELDLAALYSMPQQGVTYVPHQQSVAGLTFTSAAQGQDPFQTQRPPVQPARSAPLPPNQQARPQQQQQPVSMPVNPFTNQLTIPIDHQGQPMGSVPISQAGPAAFAGHPTNPFNLPGVNNASQSVDNFKQGQLHQTGAGLPSQLLDVPVNKSGLTPSPSSSSLVEPGPVSLVEAGSVTSTTTDEFMAILERNSAVVEKAMHENQLLRAATNGSAHDDLKFTDMVDAAGADQSTLVPDVVEEEQEDEEKKEIPTKRNIFRWGSAKERKPKTPATPPNSPTTEVKPVENSQGKGGNEQKFMGEGQTFKGKLIGVLEVAQARGDRMCQDALQELKMAIKASGEHKQRVLIHIAVDGLKIRDEKTGDCLYHHPVHKISFIAQDMSDSRAFGYIYGSPENGHRFFGIKTEKAAGQVVVAMRDLFQVVFELKTKEIDETIKKMEKDKRQDMLPPHHPNAQQLQSQQQSSVASFPDGVAGGGGPSCVRGGGQASGALSDLLGLENELTSIQAGIRQIDKIAPSAPMSFQTDSMIPIGSLQPSSTTFPGHSEYAGLPHAPTVQQAMTLPAQQQSPVNPALLVKPPTANTCNSQPPNHDPFGATPFLPPPPSKTSRHGQNRYQLPPGDTSGMEDRYAAFDSLASAPTTQHQPQQQHNAFGFNPTNAQGAIATSTSEGLDSLFTQHSVGSTGPASMASSMDTSSGTVGVPKELFTDLDPLGTGRSRPYVDKKDFFSELKPTAGPKLGDSSRQLMGPAAELQRPESSADTAAPSSVGYSSGDVSCPPVVSSVSSHVSTSSNRTHRHYSGQQPVPPPRVGSELTHSFTDRSKQTRNIYGHIEGFGFSAHLSEPHPSSLVTTTTSTTVNLDSGGQRLVSTSSSHTTDSITTSCISSWRTGNSNAIQDSRLYHTLGRPMTTFSGNTSSSLSFSRPSSGGRSLQVSLPPEEVVIIAEGPSPLAGTSPRSDGQPEQGYGSIPQLEASPRRYNRHKELCEFQYDSASTSLGIPGVMMEVVPSDTPPKLPERAPKMARTASPPPLPPKKPVSQQNSKGSITQTSDDLPATDSHPPGDIYDFPGMPMIGSVAMGKIEARKCISDILHSEEGRRHTTPSNTDTDHNVVSVEDLSRMSVMELNEKMTSGQLPSALKGMSIFELVDYIAKQMKSPRQAISQLEPTSSFSAMKPSFSDNFVSDQAPTSSLTQKDKPPKPSPLDTHMTRLMGEQQQNSSSSLSPGPPSTTSRESGFSYPPASSSNNQSRMATSSGFDDDFAQFPLPTTSIGSSNVGGTGDSLSRPSSQALSDGSAMSQQQRSDDQYDKYAAFRELQMEEELIRAWKSPSDEENPIEGEEKSETNSIVDQEGEEEVVAEMMDTKKDPAEPSAAGDGDYYGQHHICSSEDSHSSPSDSPVKSASDDQDQMSRDGEKDASNAETGQNLEDKETQLGLSHDIKRDSQIPIYNAEEEADMGEDEEQPTPQQPDIVASSCTEKSLDPSSRQDSFGDSFFSDSLGNDLKVTKQWTTFDDTEMALAAPASEETTPPLPDDSWQPATVTPQQLSSTALSHQASYHSDTHSGSLEESPPLNSLPQSEMRQSTSITSTGSRHHCHRFSHRQHDASHLCRGNSAENPESEYVTGFTDWWPPSAEGAPKKPNNPVVVMCDSPFTDNFTGTGNDAYTGTPDHRAADDRRSSQRSAVSTTPPAYEGREAQPCESVSDTTSGDMENFANFGSPSLYPPNNGLSPAASKGTSDVFNAAASLDNVSFKVLARVVPSEVYKGNPNGLSAEGHDESDKNGLIPKSDSVNIFTIKDDPFADDFFQ